MLAPAVTAPRFSFRISRFACAHLHWFSGCDVRFAKPAAAGSSRPKSRKNSRKRFSTASRFNELSPYQILNSTRSLGYAVSEVSPLTAILLPSCPSPTLYPSGACAGIWRSLLWLGILTVLIVAAIYSMGDDGSLANFVLGAAVLLLTGLTLDLTYLRGPKLVATRPDELGVVDVVFFADPKQMAADFLVQVHTAVANVGGRSAVLTTIKLVEITNGNGQRIDLPNTPAQIQGTEYRTWTHWREGEQTFERTITPPPFVLAPDGVMVFRFRAGRGIEWGTKWTLEMVRDLREVLASDIKGGVIEVGYREGEKLRMHRLRIQVRTEGLPAFLDILDGALERLPQGPLPQRQARID